MRCNLVVKALTHRHDTARVLEDSKFSEWSRSKSGRAIRAAPAAKPHGYAARYRRSEYLNPDRTSDGLITRERNDN
jgi:hypothetical protein